MLEDKTLLSAADKTGLPPLHKAVILGEVDIAENIAKEFVEALTVTDNVSVHSKNNDEEDICCFWFFQDFKILFNSLAHSGMSIIITTNI